MIILGIYGFALYITAWFLLVFYLIWAIVPTPVLNHLGLTYVPSKYWAIAGPLFILINVTAFVVIIFTLNVIRFRGYAIFENVQVSKMLFSWIIIQEVENDFGEREGFQGLSAEEARAELRKKRM